MLHWFVLVLFIFLITGPAPEAGAAGAKPKKEPVPEEKKKEVAVETHKVKRGETLWGIARLHGVSIGAIMDLNHLGDSTLLDGQVLKIPPPGADPALAPAKASSHTIAKGETFRSIARKYGLTQDELERANPKTDPAAPKAGSKLTIPAAEPVAEKSAADTGKPKPSSGVSHTVTDKDTYYTIAKKYGTTESAIAAANPGVNPARLHPGSKLSIPQRAAPAHKDDAGPAAATGKKSVARTNPDDPADSAKPAADEKPKTRRYVVSADETPQTISEAFDIPLKKLYEMNGLKPGSPMEEGLEIQVPILPGSPVE